MKKYFMSLITVLGLLAILVAPQGCKLISPDTAHAAVLSHAVSDPTQSVLPPSAVGTYNDFGQVVRLDINPKGTNASQFKVYWKRSNTEDKYQSYYVDATPNYQGLNYVWYVRTGFTVPSLGWYDLMVVSVRSDGNTSKPWTGSIDVMH